LHAKFKQEESKKEFWKKKKGKNQYKDKKKHGDKPESSKNGGESSKNQGKNLIKRRYNALIVIILATLLLNIGSIKIGKEISRSKKQMLLKKIQTQILTLLC